jgi:hypothetical protein
MAIWILAGLALVATTVLVVSKLEPRVQPLEPLDTPRSMQDRLKALLYADQTLEAELGSLAFFEAELRRLMALVRGGQVRAALAEATRLRAAPQAPGHWRLLEAHALAQSGDKPAAVAALRVHLESVEGDSHATLQAWRWLNQLGVPAPREPVLGAIQELGRPEGVDTLAAYADGGTRLFSKLGGAILGLDTRAEVQEAALAVIEEADPWVSRAIPERERQPVEQDVVRFTLLVPAGPRVVETRLSRLQAGGDPLQALHAAFSELSVRKQRRSAA